MNGEFTPQPFISPDKTNVALYNGEVYNFKTFGVHYTSDGQCILDAYAKYGEVHTEV